MKRIDLTLTDALEHKLEEPAFIESPAELPMALMHAVGDFLDAYNGNLVLPLHITAAPAGTAAELALVTTDFGARGDSLGDMNSFVVHVSDAHGLDQQTAIRVDDSMDLGRAAQVALDELVDKHGAKIAFPVFIDIQLSKDFHDRAGMYTGAASAAPTR